MGFQAGLEDLFMPSLSSFKQNIKKNLQKQKKWKSALILDPGRDEELGWDGGGGAKLVCLLFLIHLMASLSELMFVSESHARFSTFKRLGMHNMILFETVI